MGVEAHQASDGISVAIAAVAMAAGKLEPRRPRRGANSLGTGKLMGNSTQASNESGFSRVAIAAVNQRSMFLGRAFCVSPFLLRVGRFGFRRTGNARWSEPQAHNL